LSLLAVENLTKNFNGFTALDSVKLQVGPGEIHSLIGPNGAGKTTLVNIISGMLPATAGEIKFKGRQIRGLRPDKIASLGIGRTFQNIRLFKTLTVIENVMVGRHCRTKVGFLQTFFRLPFRTLGEERQIRSVAEELLDFVGLSERQKDQSGSLPYGSQRRLEIARALGTEPSLLLLDEPCAGMNSTETAQLADLVLNIRDRGVTVLLIEHDMNLVMRISNCITVLNFGVNIAEGRPEEIRSSPTVIEAYLGV
jgi:branched-chain amino acid transport system ATP-binding protein